MFLSFITPTAYIKKYQKQGHFVLALSHLIEKDKETEYEKEIKATDLPIWLDNGAFEKGHPEGIDSLLSKARKIDAELVFAPDFWGDMKQTRNGLENFLYIKNKLGADDIKTGVVIQASTWEEFLQFYEECLDNPQVDVIGINHYTTSKVWQSKGQRYSKKNPFIHKPEKMVQDRIEVLKFLNEKFGKRNRRVHLLGLGGGYEDVIYAAKNLPWVISNDTSAPFWAAHLNVKMEDSGSFSCGKIKKPVDFDFKDMTPEQLKIAGYNIIKIKTLCN